MLAPVPLAPPATRSRRPPAQALAWVAAAVGDGARVVATRRLRGGASSAVHAVTVETAHGARTHLVLRRIEDTAWLAREPDLVAHEAAALRALATSGVPAPRLVAADASGRRAGVPAVLMTRLPGRIALAPPDLARHVEALADVLPRIHAVRLGARTHALPPYTRYTTGPDREPLWPHDASAWRALIAYVACPPAHAPAVFVHRDFHPGNALFTRARITGVVDWMNAAIGPPAVDVGHCRWNLAALHGVPAADAFLARWTHGAGVAVHDPWWDIACLLDANLDALHALDTWRVAGRTDLTPRSVRRRLDAYAVSLARRL